MSIKSRQPLGISVFDAAIERLLPLYKDGHRLVVSFSGGKDSTCVLETALIAARMAGRLPVEVMMQDEEIAFPGTYEYAQRVMDRPEIKFHWLICRQPMVNVYCRTDPYWWIFDPLLDPAKWVRTFPDEAEEVTDLNLEELTSPKRFPPPPGKNLYAVIGLRVAESQSRMYGLFSSGSHITKPNALGVRNVRPCYDWSTADVWRLINETKCDYNHAYDMMNRFGIKRERMRVAPPSMNIYGVELLQMARKAWPRWFERVSARLPAVRLGAQFGRAAVTPHRHRGETWQACFERECVHDAPVDWIRDRAVKARGHILSTHGAHSTGPLPEVTACHNCVGNIGSWKSFAMVMYNGDPYSGKATFLPPIEPDFFRKGSGFWTGRRTW